MLVDLILSETLFGVGRVPLTFVSVVSVSLYLPSGTVQSSWAMGSSVGSLPQALRICSMRVLMYPFGMLLIHVLAGSAFVRVCW